MRMYPIYKGLQKPLVYRGFKGKFIAYGICSLGLGLVLGGFSGALINMYFGGIITIVSIALGLFYTFTKQKSGLHEKTRSRKIHIHPIYLRRGYGKIGI
ncbi:plasmid transfer protein [Pedobacter ginsenosidimutans]|uniref:Plasmid transfer protein n=2 Tax=Pedobacter ginsenosidimutans TaxID=687842 RepID=A0A0T5VV39_9SPHI|nr:plasmid transfer protein [Pedobacter ginsenosidimutans]